MADIEVRIDTLTAMVSQLLKGQELLLARVEALSSPNLSFSASSVFDKPGHVHRPKDASSSQVFSAAHDQPNPAELSRIRPGSSVLETASGSHRLQSAADCRLFASPAEPSPVASDRDRQQRSSPPIMYMDSTSRMVLHFFLMITSFFEFFTVSAALVAPCTHFPWQMFTLVLFVFTTFWLIVELALNFFTPVHVKEWAIVENIQESRKKYLRTWFLWDLAMCIPLDLFVLPWTKMSGQICFQDGVDPFSVLSLLRLLHMVRVPSYFRRRNPILGRPRIVIIGWFFTVSFLLMHTLAVIWMLVYDPQEDEDHGFTNQYFQAMNWGFQNFVHGHGEVDPFNMISQILVFVVRVLGFLVTVTIEAKLAEFFVNQDPFHVWARQRRRQLASVIVENQVPWELQKSVMAMYPAMLEVSKREFYNVVEELPAFLSAKIKECIKLQMVRSVPLFAE
eukprot:RCo027091